MIHATTQVVTTLSRGIRRDAAALAAESAGLKDNDRKAVHQVRVVSRRLRASLGIAGDAGYSNTRAVEKDLRRLTSALGRVRELDVTRELLPEFAKKFRWPASAVERVDVHCAKLRDKALADQRKVLARFEPSTVAARAAEAARLMAGERDAGEDKAGAAIAASCAARADRLGRALRAAGTIYAAEPLHRLRIATKKLRYTLRASGRTFAPFVHRDVRRLKKFQERLGRIHDAQVTQRLVRELAAKKATGVGLAAQLAEMDQALEIYCRRLHGQILDARHDIEETVRGVARMAAREQLPPRAERMARMDQTQTRRRPAKAVGN